MSTNGQFHGLLDFDEFNKFYQDVIDIIPGCRRYINGTGKYYQCNDTTKK